MEPFRVGWLDYRSRDIGYGVESDCLFGYWTGEVDTWGKHTFLVIDDPQGVGVRYLFTDEIEGWTTADASHV